MSAAAADFASLARELCQLAGRCHSRGWAPATSGNFSAVASREPLRLAITPRGADKGRLTPEMLLEVDASGAPIRGDARPSAETALHLAVVRARGAGAVAHTHSLWS